MTAQPTPPLLELSHVHKRYGGVVALRDAHLSCRQGEIHALLGSNGSGKSTLDKILTGVVAADAGEIRIGGKEVAIGSPRDAARHRIAAVYQELSLVGDLSVAANIALGVEPAVGLGFLNRKETRARARDVLGRFGAAFARSAPVDEQVANLAPGEQQIVEICKALVRDPAILVLDEATASLHRAQVDALFEVVRDLRAQGVLVIFTSHRMGEIFEVCDRATVLRNGGTVGTVALDEVDDQDLVRMMIGKTVAARPGRDGEAGHAGRTPVLSVHDLATDRLRDIDFTVAPGEVLGVGGLQGQGQSELLAALFGAQRLRAGRIVLDGKVLRLRRPAHAVAAGIALVPGNRGRQGLFAQRPILENLAVPSMPGRAFARTALSGPREERAARSAVQRLRIKIGSLADPVATLSGGNQQKVVVGKWLLTNPRVVLLDDPTKGIDVEAKDELFAIIDDLREEGVAVVFNSSEDRELLDLSDRVLVLFEGRVADVLEGDRLTEDVLVAAALQVEERSA